jgi:hypothetical protein
MRFKVTFIFLIGILLFGCTSLGEKGQQIFPEFTDRENTPNTTLSWVSPTNSELLTSLDVNLRVSVSSLSNVETLFFFWCKGDKTATNFSALDINRSGSFQLATNVAFSEEGTYYLWMKAILTGRKSASSSSILIQVYTNMTRAHAPLFSPLPGESYNPITLVLSSSTPGATIYWTTNNWQTLSSQTSPVTVSINFGEYELKAYATKDGYLQSDTVVGTYKVRVAPVTPSIPGGSYTNTLSLTLTSLTTNATIVWTTNDWTSTSTSVSLVLPTGIWQLKAYATKNGFFSATNSWEYFVSSSLATPTLSPNGGTYDAITMIRATTATEGATLFLSTNGTTWLATNAIILPPGTWTVKAYASKDGNTSLTNSQTYTITETRVASPLFTPEGGIFPTNITISIVCPTSGASIYWTTNESTWYTSYSLTLTSGTIVLKSYATKTGLIASTTNIVTYAIEDTLPPTPQGNITISEVQSSSAKVSWLAASDNATPVQLLQYQLVYAQNASLIDSISKVTNPSVGVSVIPWTANMTNATLSSLYDNTTYFVNVAVRDTSGNVSLFTNSPVSFTTPVASSPSALFTIIFSNWNQTRTLYLPGDHNNWDPNSFTLTNTAGSTTIVTLSNTIIPSVIARGADASRIELKVINQPNWVDQWSFSSWTIIGPIVLYDSGKQIAIACDQNDNVTILFDVGNSKIIATVESRP